MLLPSSSDNPANLMAQALSMYKSMLGSISSDGSREPSSELTKSTKDGSSMGDPSLPIHSSHLTFASSTAAIDRPELQEDYPEWTTAFPGILQDSDMYFFDTCFDSLVSQDAS